MRRSPKPGIVGSIPTDGSSQQIKNLTGKNIDVFFFKLFMGHSNENGMFILTLPFEETGDDAPLI